MITKLDDVWDQSERLNFQNLGKRPKHKTNDYQIMSRHNGCILGEVKWHGAWRQYTFWPVSDTLFDYTCLLDIAEFCDLKTAEHFKRRPKSIPSFRVKRQRKLKKLLSKEESGLDKRYELC